MNCFSEPGDFTFESSQFFSDVSSGEIQAWVCRENGCDGSVTVHYTTVYASRIDKHLSINYFVCVIESYPTFCLQVYKIFWQNPKSNQKG